MRGRLPLAAVGLPVFLLALLVNLPIAWTLDLARDRLPAALSWVGAEGTVFKARIRHLTLAFPGGRRVDLDRLTVQARWLPLLRGRFEAVFQAQACGGRLTGRASFGWAGWRMPRLEGACSLAGLAGVLPELALAGVSGQLRFEGRDLSGRYRSPPAAGRLESRIDGLRIGLLEDGGSLGNYTLSLDGGAGGWRGRLSTVPGEALLTLDGEGELDAAGRFRFQGYARAAAHAPEAVQSLLALLGPVEDGQARIDWRTTLSMPR